MKHSAGFDANAADPYLDRGHDPQTIMAAALVSIARELGELRQLAQRREQD